LLKSGFHVGKFQLVLARNTRWSLNPRKLESFFGAAHSLVAKSAQVGEFFWRGALAGRQVSPRNLQSFFGAAHSLVAKSAQVAELF
jgi:hypothetical protein